MLTITENDYKIREKLSLLKNETYEMFKIPEKLLIIKSSNVNTSVCNRHRGNITK